MFKDWLVVFKDFLVVFRDWLVVFKDWLVVFKENGWRLKRKVISKTRHSQNMFWTRHHCILTPKRILISVTTRCSLKKNSFNYFNLNAIIESTMFLVDIQRGISGHFIG